MADVIWQVTMVLEDLSITQTQHIVCGAIPLLIQWFVFLSVNMSHQEEVCIKQIILST